MAKVYYFTDGSVKKDIGASGFAVMRKNGHIVDTRIYGICSNNSHYCEAIAINKTLDYIIKFGAVENTHILVTDSDSCFQKIHSLLAYVYSGEKPKEKYAPIFCQIVDKYLYLINGGHLFEMKLVKSHAGKNSQIKYQSRIGAKYFTNDKIQLFNYGNYVIDSLVKYAVMNIDFVEEPEEDCDFIYEFSNDKLGNYINNLNCA